jgi:endoglucanase
MKEHMVFKNTILNKTPKIILIIFSFLFLYFPIFAAQDYRDALYKTIYYFGAQRCGNTASWIHAACHVKDGQTPGGPGGIDLTGGWHDCGDHVKWMGTGAFAAGTMLVAFDNFPSSFEDRYAQANSTGSPNGIPDVLDEIKVYTDFLIKACDGTKVYYQQGNFTNDHKHNSEPADYSASYTISEGGESDGGRPTNFFTSGGSNLCGKAAATLALMAIAYQPYDAAYATSCFNKAKQYYTIGDASHTVVSDAQGGFYSESKWQCHMSWGAIEIYRASVARGAAEAAYLTKAQTYFTDSAGSWPLTWDQTPQLACFELYKVTGSATYKTWLQSEVAYYKGKLQTCGIGQYWFIDTWGHLKVSAAAAFIALLAQSINPDATALAQAKSTIDFILGTHGDISGSPGTTPQGRSFIVGYTNPDYASAGWAKHPHHRAAFGYTLAQSADTKWAAEAAVPDTWPYKHVLIGSLVGGPEAACGSFNDNIDKYQSTEGGLDYNAPIVSALAALIYIANPPTPTITRTSTVTLTPNLSMTRTFTSTVTPTFTITPVPPPTNKLNLEVMSQGSSDSCSTQTFGFQYKITNWETTVVNTSNISIKIWVDTTDTITGSIYNARKYDSTGTDQGTITAVIAEGAGSGCAGATKSVVITVTSTDIPPNGGSLMIQGALERGGYQTPFDAGCNDYTKMVSTWTTYQNNPTQNLYQGTNLVCEYISNTTQDPATGLNPCTGANGCGAPTTPTFTPAITNTYTMTATGTMTKTQTASPTLSATNSFTFTATSSFTASRTSTPTMTLTSTLTGTNTPGPSYSSTPTVTASVTYTNTGTFTQIPTASRTPSSTATIINTFTFTVSGTFTNTATASFTPTKTATLTFTPSSTATFSATPTYTNTFTKTGTFTPTPSFTRTVTMTFTISETSTVSPVDTPYAGTPTDTATITETYTITLTGTSTPTDTFTATDTITPTYTATPTNTGTGTDTNTPTLTYTQTFTLTETQTGTVTPVFTYTSTPSNSVTSTLTVTQANTATKTATLTPVNTATSTYTSTPVNTATSTYTSTSVNTVTSTYTLTPVNTATQTETLLPELSATITPANHIEVVTKTPVIIYPNPNPSAGTNPDRFVQFTVSKPIVKTTLKIYTKMSRLIRVYEDKTQQAQGKAGITIPGSRFSGLAKGIYYYVIMVKDEGGNYATSPIEKVLIQ